MSRCHLEGDSSWFIRSALSVRAIGWSGEAARGDTSFYFLNVCGLCSRENRRVCDRSCFAVMEEGEGGGGKKHTERVFDAWREASVCRGTLEMKVVTRVGPLPAGCRLFTLEWDTRGSTTCTVKGTALLCGADMSVKKCWAHEAVLGHVSSSALPLSWVTRRNTHLFYCIIKNDTTCADFTTKTEQCVSPRRTRHTLSSSWT